MEGVQLACVQVHVCGLYAVCSYTNVMCVEGVQHTRVQTTCVWHMCMIAVKLCSHDTLVLHVSILCTRAALVVAYVLHLYI